MSRLELDQIQTQLKIAIQNHQILVSRLQIQPQETDLKAKLHNLQKDIIIMCQKQKLVVEKLGKDLIEKKPNNPPQSLQVVEKQILPTRNTVPAVRPEISEPLEPHPVLSSESPQCVSDPSPAHSDKSSVSKTSTPSPIRVPQYPVNRPAVLQNNNCISADHSVILNRKSPTGKNNLLPSVVSLDFEKVEQQKQLKKKITFMASLDLVPPDTLKEVSCKRSERKRKSTNNPNFAYGFELEKRPRLSNFLTSEYFGAKKSKAVNQTSSSESSASTSPDHSSHVNQTKNGKENVHESVCSVCGMNGQLLMCDTCSSVYHLQCLTPPLESVPQGQWICSKCQEAQRKSISLAAVNAYISNKTGKEEEKRKLLKRSTELLQEKQLLENKTKQLNEILTRQGLRKEELIQINRDAQLSVEKLKKFVELVQSS